MNKSKSEVLLKVLFNNGIEDYLDDIDELEVLGEQIVSNRKIYNPTYFEQYWTEINLLNE